MHAFGTQIEAHGTEFKPKAAQTGIQDGISQEEGFHIGTSWALDPSMLIGRCTAARHLRLKHAAAFRSTCFWGLLVGVLKHAAAH